MTITFDNTEKDQSPVGYEMYAEIVVSRQVSAEMLLVLAKRLPSVL